MSHTASRVITYLYDPLGRLTKATYSTGESFAYAYDAVGNRTATTATTPLAGTTVTTYTYDAANRLTSAGGVAYTWDDRGNLTSDGTFTYTYNAAGRLVRAQSLTATLVYTYSADGLRLAQAVNGSVMTTTWDLALPLAQVLATSDGALDLYGLGRIAEVRGGAWAYPLGDALGSVRQWTDDAGNVTYAAGYTPYGETLWQAGSTQSAWGFTGEWCDGYIKFTYLRARWYSNQIGRFASPDPIVPDFWNPQSINDYVYVLGNPVNAVDPAGKYPVPLPRPGDVCPSPTESTIPPRSTIFHRSEYILRRADGSVAYLPAPGVTEWWYCGEFKITAYQFVDEADASGSSWYADAGGSAIAVTTADGITFNANDLFVQDVMQNGTGKPAAQACQEQSNYFHYDPWTDAFYCGKGKPFDPTTDAYQAVAAHTAVLRTNAQVYVPGLEDHSDPRGNADFVVRDTGGGLAGNQIDVFVGEGPGILSGKYNDCPALQYTAYQAGRGARLGGMALYQRSRYHYSLFPCLLVEDQP